MWSYTYTDELYHYGRKGMKWYQNIFTKGKNRKGRSSGDSDNDSDEEKRSGGSRSSGSGKKSVRDMSDEELVKAINRARMEDTYHALRPEQESAAKKFVKSFAKEAIAPAAIHSGKRFLEGLWDKYSDTALKRMFPEEADPMKKLKKEYDLKKLKKDIKDLDKPEKENWENMLKKQQYEKNAKNTEYDDVKAKWDKERIQKDYDDWKRQNEKPDDSDDNRKPPSSSSSTSSNKEPEVEIIGEGKSRHSWDDDNGPTIDADFVSADNVSAGKSWLPSVINESVSSSNSSAGETFVKGLLELYD